MRTAYLYFPMTETSAGKTLGLGTIRRLGHWWVWCLGGEDSTSRTTDQSAHTWDLGFCTVWRPHGGQTSHMVAQSPSIDVPANNVGASWLLVTSAQKLRSDTSTLLCWSKLLPKPIQRQEKMT